MTNRGRRRHTGFTLIEVLISVAIVGLLGAIAIPIFQDATKKSRRMALAADLSALHVAFVRYFVDHGRFPPDSGTGRFDVSTLSPLSTEGYYDQAESLTEKLQNNQLLIYFAPDIKGPDSSYIVLVRPEAEPTLLAYAISLDWGALTWAGYEGVYFLKDGQLVRPDEVN